MKRARQRSASSNGLEWVRFIKFCRRRFASFSATLNLLPTHDGEARAVEAMCPCWTIAFHLVSRSKSLLPAGSLLSRFKRREVTLFSIITPPPK